MFALPTTPSQRYAIAIAAAVGIFATPALAGLMDGAAYADPGDLTGPSCVASSMTGSDGYFHFHPADHPEIDIKVAACTPTTTPRSAATCAPAAQVGSDGYAHSLDGGPDLPSCPASAAPAGPKPQQTRAKTTVPKTRTTTPRRTVAAKTTHHRVCGTWWVAGLDSHGHGGTRAGHRGQWHIVRACKVV